MGRQTLTSERSPVAPARARAVEKKLGFPMEELQDRLSHAYWWVLWVDLRVCSDACLRTKCSAAGFDLLPLEIRANIRRGESKRLERVIPMLERRMSEVDGEGDFRDSNEEDVK